MTLKKKVLCCFVKRLPAFNSDSAPLNTLKSEFRGLERHKTLYLHIETWDTKMAQWVKGLC